MGMLGIARALVSGRAKKARVLCQSVSGVGLLSEPWGRWAMLRFDVCMAMQIWSRGASGP